MAPIDFVPETTVLKRKAAELTDENEWLQFDLHDAVVRDNKGRITDLFLASPENPLTITGQLMLKNAKADVRSALLPAYKSRPRIPLLLDHVTYFAFGTFDTGAVAAWAAGAAGWHTIHPSDIYKPIYKHMEEGLDLLYYLIDSYEEDIKRPWHVVFDQYAAQHKSTREAVAAKFYDHASFLAMRMAQNEQGILWGATSFYMHLRKKHPEAFAPLKAAQSKRAPVKAPSPSPPPQAVNTRRQEKSREPQAVAERTRGTRSMPVQPPAVAAAERQAEEVPAPRPGRPSRSAQPAPAQEADIPRRPGRPRKASAQAATPIPLLSDENKKRAREVWKFMQRKTNETLPEVEEMTVATFGKFLFQDYEFADEFDARYFLLYLAPDLVSMMTIPRGRSYDPWTELPMYDELLEARVPARAKGKMAALQLQKRKQPLVDDPQTEEEESESSGAEESIIDEQEAQVRQRKRDTARRRISALRPKSGSKYSSKAAKRKGKEKIIDDENDEDEDQKIHDNDEEQRDMMSPTPSKRKSLSEDEDEPTPHGYPNKRFTRSQGANDPELEDLEFEIQQARSTGIPIRRKPSTTAANGEQSPPAPAMYLESEPAASTDANAPGDIWTCPHMGCVHKVYGASESDSKQLIREHLLDHKEKDKVDVLKSEEAMSRLPVSHLLKRIREMAERAGEGGELRKLEDGGMGLFPSRLERALVG